MPPNRKASLFVGLAPYDNFILSKDRWYYNFYMYSRNLLDVFPCRVTNVHSQRVYRQFPYCANAEKNICTVWQNKMYQALVNTNVVQGSWPVIIGFVFGYVELLGLGILFMLFLSTPERVLLRWGYISTCHRSSFVYKTNITWYRHEISFVHPSYSRITKSSPWPLFMYFNNWSVNSTLAHHRDGRCVLVTFAHKKCRFTAALPYDGRFIYEDRWHDPYHTRDPGYPPGTINVRASTRDPPWIVATYNTNHAINMHDTFNIVFI